MRVLSIGADRAPQGINRRGSAAYQRQRAYAEVLGALTIINYTLERDRLEEIVDGPLRIYPTAAPLKILYGTYALLRALRLPKPDILDAQDPHMAGLLALFLARWYKVPLHIQVHADIFSVSYSVLSLTNFLRLHIALFVLKRADGIRVVSDRVRLSIEARLTPKRAITVLPIFVDAQKFATAGVPDALRERFARYSNRLLFVGRLEAEKNCARAIRAFNEAAPREACLIVVGDGSNRAALEALARELGIADRVFFEGSLDAAPYYALADLVLVPSKYEGYGLVIVEALAAGKPVLATDVGIARESGAIVADEENYAAALKEWFTNGPKTGTLLHYPYTTFQQYVDAYAADLRACLGGN